MKGIKKILVAPVVVVLVLAYTQPAFATPPVTGTSPPGTYPTTPTPDKTTDPRVERDRNLPGGQTFPQGTTEVDVLKAPVPHLTEEHDKLEPDVITFEGGVALVWNGRVSFVLQDDPNGNYVTIRSATGVPRTTVIGQVVLPDGYTPMGFAARTVVIQGSYPVGDGTFRLVPTDKAKDKEGKFLLLPGPPGGTHGDPGSGATCGQVGDTGCSDQHPPGSGSGTVKPEPGGGTGTDCDPASGAICQPPGCCGPPADAPGSTSEQGKIIGGEWVGDSKSKHPDFLWWPSGKTDAKMFRPQGKGGLGLVIEGYADGRYIIKRPDRDPIGPAREPAREPTKLEWPNLRITMSEASAWELWWDLLEPPSSPPDPGRVTPDEAPPIMFRPGTQGGTFTTEISVSPVSVFPGGRSRRAQPFEWPEGTQIEKRSDGTVVGRVPNGNVGELRTDGSFLLTYPNGTTMLFQTQPDGTQTATTIRRAQPFEWPEGTQIEKRSDGAVVGRVPNGNVGELRTNGSFLLTYPNGTTLLFENQPDGTQTVRTIRGAQPADPTPVDPTLSAPPPGGKPGEIIAGEWAGGSKPSHPDFLWLPSNRTAPFSLLPDKVTLRSSVSSAASGPGAALPAGDTRALYITVGRLPAEPQVEFRPTSGIRVVRTQRLDGETLVVYLKLASNAAPGARQLFVKDHRNPALSLNTGLRLQLFKELSDSEDKALEGQVLRNKWKKYRQLKNSDPKMAARWMAALMQELHLLPAKGEPGTEDFDVTWWNQFVFGLEQALIAGAEDVAKSPLPAVGTTQALLELYNTLSLFFGDPGTQGGERGLRGQLSGRGFREDEIQEISDEIEEIYRRLRVQVGK